jgi:dolichol-phosphate mannosyltransferase
MDKRTLTTALLAVLVVGAAPALAAHLTNSVPIEDNVPVSTPSTPTIVLQSPGGQTDVNMSGDTMFQGSDLRIQTGDGNITVSGDTGASAQLDTTDIEGTSTQVTSISAGSSWLNLDPDDKNRMDVRGDADSLSFQSIAVDDGNTDLQLTGTVGGTAELRLYGLSANTHYALYDSSRDEVLGNFTTDGSGEGQTDVAMPDGSHSLEVRTAGSFSQPTVSSPAPTGKVSSPPSTIEAQVNATAWNATVTFELDGSTVATKEVEQNGTYSADDAEAMLEPLENGYEHVIGDRFADMREGAMTKLNRIGNRIINRSFTTIHGEDFGDILSGYRAFTTDSFDRTTLTADGFGIETEMSVECVKHNVPTAVVPITYRPRPSGSDTNLRPFRDGGIIFLEIYRRAKTNNPLFYFGGVGSLALLAGVVFGGYVGYDWFVNGISHEVIAVVAAFGIIVGVQLLMFGVLSDMLLDLHEEQIKRIDARTDDRED